VDGHSGIGHLARRFIVGLTRKGVSVYGAQELLVSDKNNGALLRALVFPVTVDGIEYLVSTRPHAAWVKSLRAAGRGELRCGRRQRTSRAVRVADTVAATVHETYQRDVPTWLSSEPAHGPVIAFALSTPPGKALTHAAESALPIATPKSTRRSA
jgi:hypothetical protein